MKEIYKCSSTVNDKTSRQVMTVMINKYDWETCGCNAKYFENGKWYCGKHAPSKVQEREQKRYDNWNEKNK